MATNGKTDILMVDSFCHTQYHGSMDEVVIESFYKYISCLYIRRVKRQK